MVGTLPKPKARAWGVYIKNLKDVPHVDGKVVTLLEQIKDLYRNPIIHPEARLEMKEALSLIGIAESATSAMLKDMKLREAAKASDAQSLPKPDWSHLSTEAS
jgi:hypothetical protein